MFSGARPEFAHLSEAEVWAALDRDDDDDNSIACEVTRLICCFWKRFQDSARKHGNIPPEIMHVSTRCPIEKVAVLIMIGYVESETGIPGHVTQH